MSQPNKSELSCMRKCGNGLLWSWLCPCTFLMYCCENNPEKKMDLDTWCCCVCDWCFAGQDLCGPGSWGC